MAQNEAARRTAEPIVVSSSPDVCLTSGAPVPYSIVAYFPPSIQLADRVLFTEDPAFTVVSSIPGVIGDEAGDGGGVSSGTHAGGGFNHVVSGSHTPNVLAQGNRVVFHLSEMEMNCPSPLGPGNTRGFVLWQSVTRGAFVSEQGVLEGLMNPALIPENEAELRAVLGSANAEPATRWRTEGQAKRENEMPERFHRGRGSMRDRPTPQRDSFEARITRQTTHYDESWRHWGDNDNYVRLGRRQLTSSQSAGRTNDGWEAEANYEARVSALDAQGRIGNDDANARVRVEALAAGASARARARITRDGVDVNARLRAEAVLARAEAEGSFRITLQDIVNSLPGVANPLMSALGQNVIDLPDWLGENGIVISGGAEGVAGAMATAEGELRANRRGVRVGGRLGGALGLGGSLKAVLGIEVSEGMASRVASLARMIGSGWRGGGAGAPRSPGR